MKLMAMGVRDEKMLSYVLRLRQVRKLSNENVGEGVHDGNVAIEWERYSEKMTGKEKFTETGIGWSWDKLTAMQPPSSPEVSRSKGKVAEKENKRPFLLSCQCAFAGGKVGVKWATLLTSRGLCFDSHARRYFNIQDTKSEQGTDQKERDLFEYYYTLSSFKFVLTPTTIANFTHCEWEAVAAGAAIVTLDPGLQSAEVVGDTSGSGGSIQAGRGLLHGLPFVILSDTDAKSNPVYASSPSVFASALSVTVDLLEKKYRALMDEIIVDRDEIRAKWLLHIHSSSDTLPPTLSISAAPLFAQTKGYLPFWLYQFTNNLISGVIHHSKVF